MAVDVDNALSRTEQARLLRERFGLSVDPFAGDTAFFFTGGQRQHHLDALRHLAAFGDMLLLLSGEEGSGRSRLLQQLAESERQRLVVHELPVAALQQPARLASVLGRLSGQPLANLSAEAASSAFFAWSAGQPRRWLLLMDNADAVPPEVMTALLRGRRSQPGDSARAAVLLMSGLPELSRQLAEEGGADLLEDLHELPLKPLDEDDIRHYLQSAFDRVGGDASSAISPRVLSRLRQESGGRLGSLRQLAPRVLLGQAGQNESPGVQGLIMQPDAAEKPLTSRRSFSMPTAARLRLWAGLALGLLGLSFLLVSLFYEGGSGSDAPALITEDVELDELARFRQAMGESTTQADPAEALVERPEPLFAPQPLQPAPAPPTGAAPRESQPEPEVVAGPEQRPDTEVEPEQRVKEPATDQAAPQAFIPGLPAYYRHRDWIEAREAGNYSIQLLGSFNEATAIQFIQNNALEGMVYVRSRHQGQPWFVVLVGDYDGRDAARSALRQELPAALRNLNPWVRPFEGL